MVPFAVDHSSRGAKRGTIEEGVPDPIAEGQTAAHGGSRLDTSASLKAHVQADAAAPREGISSLPIRQQGGEFSEALNGPCR